MKPLEVRIADVSSCLESLMAPDVFPKVQDAVERKDRNLLVKICRKARIPETYLAVVMSVLLSIGPEQPKWPGIL